MLSRRRVKLVCLIQLKMTSVLLYNRGFNFLQKFLETERSPQVHEYSRQIVLKETIFSSDLLRLHKYYLSPRALLQFSQFFKLPVKFQLHSLKSRNVNGMIFFPLDFVKINS